MKPIVSENWSEGIGSSPYKGTQEMYNCDVFNVDGVIQPNFQLLNGADTPVITTFTASTVTNALTLTTSIERTPGLVTSVGRAFTVASTGSLPTGLAGNTVYYAIDTGLNTIQVATTIDNALSSTFITLTSNGTGTMTLTTIDPKLENFFSLNPIDHITTYGIDTNGRVWERDAPSAPWYLVVGNSTFGTNTNGNGLAIWKNYVVAFNSATIDLYGPLTSSRNSRSWTNGWQTLLQGSGTGRFHFTWISTNSILYWGDYSSGGSLPTGTTINSGYIGSLMEVPGQTFNPATAGTYSYNPNALRLPSYFFVTALSQQGENLMCGTEDNKVYPWDTVSPSFADPILLPEVNVRALLNINNVLYIACGNKGNIYLTYGSYAQKVMDFSDYLSGFPQYTITNVGLVLCQGRIFMSVVGDINSAGIAPDDQISGIYSINVVGQAGNSLDSTQNLGYTMEYSTSGGYGVNIGGMVTDATATWVTVGWFNNVMSTYGIDSYSSGSQGITGPVRASGYIAQVIGELNVVGSALEPETSSKFEINLAQPLATGQGVQISFRGNITDTFSTPIIMDYTNPDWLGSVKLFGDVNIEKFTFLQYNMQMTSPSGQNQLYDTVKVKNVILR